MERLYIFNCPTSKVFKVGVSNDVKRRVAEIRAQGYDISDDTSYFSETQDKKFILETEKVIKFLLRDSQLPLGVGKESGFSEWYGVSDSINAEATAAMLNLFFSARLNLQKDLHKLSEGPATPEFYQVYDNAINVLLERGKAKTKYVESLLSSFEVLPEYLLGFLEASYHPLATYSFTEIDGVKIFHIDNPSARLEGAHGFTLNDCLDSAEEILRYFKMHQDYTSHCSSEMTSAYGSIQVCNLHINISSMRAAFLEIQGKTGPRPLAVVNKLDSMLTLICRDKLPTVRDVLDREEE
jgi:hypothetical protein